MRWFNSIIQANIAYSGVNAPFLSLSLSLRSTSAFPPKLVSLSFILYLFLLFFTSSLYPFVLFFSPCIQRFARYDARHANPFCYDAHYDWCIAFTIPLSDSYIYTPGWCARSSGKAAKQEAPANYRLPWNRKGLLSCYTIIPRGLPR